MWAAFIWNNSFLNVISQWIPIELSANLNIQHSKMKQKCFSWTSVQHPILFILDFAFQLVKMFSLTRTIYLNCFFSSQRLTLFPITSRFIFGQCFHSMISHDFNAIYIIEAWVNRNCMNCTMQKVSIQKGRESFFEEYYLKYLTHAVIVQDQNEYNAWHFGCIWYVLYYYSTIHIGIEFYHNNSCSCLS